MLCFYKRIFPYSVRYMDISINCFCISNFAKPYDNLQIFPLNHDGLYSKKKNHMNQKIHNNFDFVRKWTCFARRCIIHLCTTKNRPPKHVQDRLRKSRAVRVATWQLCICRCSVAVRKFEFQPFHVIVDRNNNRGGCVRRRKNDVDVTYKTKWMNNGGGSEKRIMRSGVSAREWTAEK